MDTNESNVRTIDVNGTQLHYIELGDNSKPSVVFTHGAFSDYRSWQFQIEPFSRQYRVISYSRRHAYPNRLEGDYHFTADNDAIQQYASDLAELIQRLDLAPAHLVGHSDGAFTALYCACRNTKLVKTLVLGEPAALPLLAASQAEEDVRLFKELWENALKPAGEAFYRGDFEDGVRIFMDGIMVKGYFDQLPPTVRQSMMDNVKAFQAQLEYPMPEEFSLQELKQVSSVPTLFVRGELSPKFLHRIVEILSSHMPKSEQVTIQGTTHDLGRMTKADIFNSKVMEFLAKN